MAVRTEHDRIVPHHGVTTLAPPIAVEPATVPADGISTVYLLNLAIGSHVTLEGPEEPETFDVSDDTIALAFSTPGRYRITIRPPKGPTRCFAVRALKAFAV
jgi:hypothetical protein